MVGSRYAAVAILIMVGCQGGQPRTGRMSMDCGNSRVDCAVKADPEAAFRLDLGQGHELRLEGVSPGQRGTTVDPKRLEVERVITIDPRWLEVTKERPLTIVMESRRPGDVIGSRLAATLTAEEAGGMGALRVRLTVDSRCQAYDREHQEIKPDAAGGFVIGSASPLDEVLDAPLVASDLLGQRASPRPYSFDLTCAAGSAQLFRTPVILRFTDDTFAFLKDIAAPDGRPLSWAKDAVYGAGLRPGLKISLAAEPGLTPSLDTMGGLGKLRDLEILLYLRSSTKTVGGKCGPYNLTGSVYEKTRVYVGRAQEVTEAWLYEARTRKLVGQRRFVGPVGSCPRALGLGGREIVYRIGSGSVFQWYTQLLSAPKSN